MSCTCLVDVSILLSNGAVDNCILHNKHTRLLHSLGCKHVGICSTTLSVSRCLPRFDFVEL